MSTTSIIQKLKGIVADFVTEDGKILEVPLRGKGYSKLADERRLQFIRGMLDLILNTNFLSSMTKAYIRNRYISIKGLARELENKGFDVNENTLQTKIFRDQHKIESVFGDRVLLDLLHYDNIPIEKYERELSETFAKYADMSSFENIALQIPDTGIKTSITDEEFQDFIKILLPYHKAHMQSLSENLTDSIAYIRFILSSTLLNETDIERKALFLELFGSEQYESKS